MTDIEQQSSLQGAALCKYPSMQCSRRARIRGHCESDVCWRARNRSCKAVTARYRLQMTGRGSRCCTRRLAKATNTSLPGRLDAQSWCTEYSRRLLPLSALVPLQRVASLRRSFGSCAVMSISFLGRVKCACELLDVRAVRVAVVRGWEWQWQWRRERNEVIKYGYTSVESYQRAQCATDHTPDGLSSWKYKRSRIMPYFHFDP